MSQQFKPTLAATIEPHQLDQLQYPVLGSPKLDGIRTMVRGERALSRSLKEIPNRHIQKLLGTDVLEGFDGELMVGDPCTKTVFRDTTSAVMSQDGEPNFIFWVFDWIGQEGGFLRRFQGLEQFFYTDPEHVAEEFPFLKLVPHKILNNAQEVMEYEDELVRQGFEGLMLRRLSGEYKHGRSTLKEAILLKLKRFQDDEAVIIGFKERMHNANEAKINALGHTERSTHKANMVGRGDLGAFLVSMLKNPEVTFEIGSGFNDAQRSEYWDTRDKLIGKIVTFKHMEYGGFDAPRFPVFKGLRDVRDL